MAKIWILSFSLANCSIEQNSGESVNSKCFRKKMYNFIKECCCWSISATCYFWFWFPLFLLNMNKLLLLSIDKSWRGEGGIVALARAKYHLLFLMWSEELTERNQNLHNIWVLNLPVVENSTMEGDKGEHKGRKSIWVSTI